MRTDDSFLVLDILRLNLLPSKVEFESAITSPFLGILTGRTNSQWPEEQTCAAGIDQIDGWLYGHQPRLSSGRHELNVNCLARLWRSMSKLKEKVSKVGHLSRPDVTRLRCHEGFVRCSQARVAQSPFFELNNTRRSQAGAR